MVAIGASLSTSQCLAAAPVASWKSFGNSYKFFAGQSQRSPVSPSPAPRRASLQVQALALPELCRVVATPMLAAGRLLLKDPCAVVGLSLLLGAAGPELAKKQGKIQRLACAALAGALPFVMQQAVGALILRLGIDVARVPMQAMLDTGLASIAGTSLALVSSVMCGDEASAAIDGPPAPLVGRFLLAAVAGPVVFHAIMAAALPHAVQNAVRLAVYLIHPAVLLAANVR